MQADDSPMSVVTPLVQVERSSPFPGLFSGDTIPTTDGPQLHSAVALSPG